MKAKAWMNVRMRLLPYLNVIVVTQAYPAWVARANNYVTVMGVLLCYPRLSYFYYSGLSALNRAR